MTTEILALVDALGNLIRFHLIPGHRFDTVGVAPLIDGIEFRALLADKAFDSIKIMADLNERRAIFVICKNAGTRIENFCCKLKEFKRIAMRACKNGQEL